MSIEQVAVHRAPRVRVLDHRLQLPEMQPLEVGARHGLRVRVPESLGLDLGLVELHCRPWLRSFKLGSHLLRPRDQRLELGEREMAGEPREPAVRIDPHALGRHALEHPADPPRDQLRALDVEVLEIEDAGAQLFRTVELAPPLDLGHLAIGELEHELVGGRAVIAGNSVR